MYNVYQILGSTMGDKVSYIDIYVMECRTIRKNSKNLKHVYEGNSVDTEQI